LLSAFCLKMGRLPGGGGKKKKRGTVGVLCEVSLVKSGDQSQKKEERKGGA